MSEEQLDEFASTKRKVQARARCEIALEIGVFALLDAEVARAQKSTARKSSSRRKSSR